jgi:UDP-N-acetylglucosamine 1-carboxyvinyltransferase
MTDWQQPFCVVLTRSRGESIIHETVYEDRFGYAKDLKRMGARIEILGDCPKDPCRLEHQGYMHTAIITGPTPLKGTEIEMTDIRAGMAHIIAALSAEGESVVSGVEYIDRGYERIDERLRALGADIQRVTAIKI